MIVGFIALPFFVNADEPKQILTSIKPLALITQEIVTGTELKVDYLLSPTVSEHDYALKISDIKRLRNASLVIWLGSEMEPYLDASISSWLPSSANSLKSLSLLTQITPESFVLNRDDHQAGRTTLAHHSIDPHIWLDPILAQQAAKQISDRLSQLYPANKAQFENNYRIFSQNALVLDKLIGKTFEPYKNEPFLVYHGAYGYFVKHYALNQIGILHLQSGAVMSLKQLNSLQSAIEKQSKDVCLFREAQFSYAPVPVFQSKNHIKMGELDPLGTKADSYNDLINDLAKGFLRCFTQNEKNAG